MVDTKKEQEPRVSGVENVAVPSAEAPKSPEQNLEVEGWMEKIEKKFAQVPPKMDDSTDTSVIAPQSQPQQPPVTLPVTHKQMLAGKKAKTDMGITWLVIWAIRQLKLLTRSGRKVKLQDDAEGK